MNNSMMSALLVALFLMPMLVGCEKKSGDAVVIGKEHIAAAPPVAETPKAQSTLGPDARLRPVADDEITVDGHVMKPEVRGTSRDPRALNSEQWVVKVRMIS